MDHDVKRQLLNTGWDRRKLLNITNSIMKTKTITDAAVERSYQAPEAEVLELKIEKNIMSPDPFEEDPEF